MGFYVILVSMAVLGAAHSLMARNWAASRVKLEPVASSVSQAQARIGSQNTVTVDINKGGPVDNDYSHVDTKLIRVSGRVA